MEDRKLIFSLDAHEEGLSVAFCKNKPQAEEHQSDHSLRINLSSSQEQRSQRLFLPHSPSSSPGSLADLAESSADLLSNMSLVKSSSTELERRGSSSVRGKPLLSLAKSSSTEISWRAEPDDNLSKSDSKLHLHPRKPPGRPKTLEAKPNYSDDCVPPLLSGGMSPTESRGSSLIAEFEDTRKKFSDAMQDPLSMLSKIIGEESTSNSKQGRVSGRGDSAASLGDCERNESSEEADTWCRKRADRSQRGVCDGRVQNHSLFKSSNTSEGLTFSKDDCREMSIQKPQPNRNSWEEHQRTCPWIQVPMPGSSMPLYWLLLVGFLAYVFFVVPLPSYVTGLAVGVACGFVLGLMVVFMFAPRRSMSSRSYWDSCKYTPVNTDPGDGKTSGTLEGWMNETHYYDAETFHPLGTNSVYVTLDGTQLRLDYPCANIPRWAAFDESPHEATFVHSRIYSLTHSKVSLVPSGLARKRLWNRKYPISITLAEGESVEEVGTLEGEVREDKQSERDHQCPLTLYLFGRTGREKEEWFQQILSASQRDTQRSEEENVEPSSYPEVFRDSAEELRDVPAGMKSRVLLDYSVYMNQLMGSNSNCTPTPSPCQSVKGSPATSKKNSSEEPGPEAGSESGGGNGPEGCSAESNPNWLNSLLGRIFWDFLREKYWTDLVANKVQKKLSKIKLPYFMNELTLADLDMGTCLPRVLSTSKPTLDRRGLWLGLELEYTGCLQMTLETKMNLCKLGKDGEDEMHGPPQALQIGPRLSILADSDEESSSAGSSDEEEVPPSELQGTAGDKGSVVGADGHTSGSTSKKLLRFVDKIAKSKYFQKATENEYIKKKIAEVSNMPLLLCVEVLELSGSLAINIPPPPTDRIWYSFHVPPRLDLHVRPMFGDREVTLSHVTEWIEKKLQREFQKVLVMPNMDDLYLPLMTSALDNPLASHRSSWHSSSNQSSVESQDCPSE